MNLFGQVKCPKKKGMLSSDFVHTPFYGSIFPLRLSMCRLFSGAFLVIIFMHDISCICRKKCYHFPPFLFTLYPPPLTPVCKPVLTTLKSELRWILWLDVGEIRHGGLAAFIQFIHSPVWAPDKTEMFALHSKFLFNRTVFLFTVLTMMYSTRWARYEPIFLTTKETNCRHQTYNRSLSVYCITCFQNSEYSLVRIKNHAQHVGDKSS